MNNNEACAEYFRGNSAYRRCFSEFEKKWKTYGKVTGIITLKNTSEEERRAIGGILGKTFYENTIRFPFAEFEKGLQYTKFAPVDFEQVLEAYFGRKMLTTQERQKEAERGKADFFETVESYLTECTGPDSIAVSWLQDMFSQKKYGYQTVIREYGRDREKTEKLLKTVGKAILLLEDIRETEEEYPLAVFSAEVSGNPHYFDQGTTGGQLLVHGMCYATEEDYPANAHQWRELLLSNGIVPDNISSIVHIYGLRLQVDGDWHPAYDTFCRRQEPCAVTMENLQELTAVQPTGDKVYIVENEMVFSYLLKHLEQRNVTLLCTSGQLRSAAVKLIPFLLNSGADIYYSGDIDPDGIRIADRLWRKYGDRIHVWRMSEEDYAKSLSEEEIGKISMKKLDAVENPVLRETAREVTLDKIRDLLQEEFGRHQELATSERIAEYEKTYFAKIINGDASEVDLTASLAKLSQMLTKHYGKAPIIIIDEYDTPIQEGYSKDFYDEIIGFMRNFFSGAFKDNKNLTYGFLTGILRIAQESIFSGLNNLTVNSVMDEEYDQFFGFTVSEVREMLKYYGVLDKEEELKDWYDGYLFGSTEIYNPWSVINYISRGCIPQAYWVNTGKNEILEDVLKVATEDITERLYSLLQGERVIARIDQNVVYRSLSEDPANIYSLLLVAGYLKTPKKELQADGSYLCEVSIPNREIAAVYKSEVLSHLLQIGAITRTTANKIAESLYRRY